MSGELAARSPAQKWRALAAYVTWLVLAVHSIVRLLRIEATGAHWAGVGFFALCVVVGYAHLHGIRWRESIVRFRVSIGVQVVTALAALFFLEVDTLAILLIVVMAAMAERERSDGIVLWMLAADTALFAIYVYQFSLVAGIIRTGLQVGFQFFTVSISIALAGEREAMKQLAGLNAELVATRRLLRDSTRAQERLRISRELHDVAGHRLTALKLNLESSLRKQRKTEGQVVDLPERLELCRDLTGELLDDIRSVVHQLRKTEDVDLRRALEPLTKQLPDVAVTLEISPDLSISRIEVAQAIVRCAQEAITNALKHGRAQRVAIRVARDAQSLTLTIRDDGRGGPSGPPGHGIRGMMERAASLGGTLSIDTAAPAGWELQLVLPAEVAS